MFDEHLAFYSYVIHNFLLILRLSPRLFLGSENDNKKQIKQNKKKVQEKEWEQGAKQRCSAKIIL